PIRRRLPRDGGSPNSRTAPAETGSSPSSILISVVFPAPFAPSSPITSPGSTVRSTPSTAVNRPNRRVTPAHSASIGQLPVDRGNTDRVLEVGRQPAVPVWLPHPPAARAPPGASSFGLIRGLVRDRHDGTWHGRDHLAWRAGDQRPAGVEHQHPLRAGRLLQVRGGEQHRRAARAISHHMSARLTGSTPVVGSSSTASSGSGSSAAITPSLRRIPPDRCPA